MIFGWGAFSFLRTSRIFLNVPPDSLEQYVYVHVTTPTRCVCLWVVVDSPINLHSQVGVQV